MFNKMALSDLKLYLINSMTLLVSFSDTEAILKILLLIGSIIYTSQRIYTTYKDSKNNEKDK